MTADEVRKIVLESIGDKWDETNSHHVDLRSSLVTPSKAKMTLRALDKGKLRDELTEVWIVLREKPSDNGYVVFYDDARTEFGLACASFPEDRHRVICGYYGDFWSAFKGM